MACGAQQVCGNGTCSDTCAAGQVKCGTTCIDPATDLQHCGATAGCGVGTGAAGAACVGGQRCTAGACACAPGWLFCNGVCVDPNQDRNRCGATACTNGVACGTNEVCAAGACALSCPVGLVKCNGTCINPRTDRDHCGATADCDAAGGTAGSACSTGEVCSAGSCALSCQTGMVNCGGTCVDPSTDRLYCGATAGCGATSTSGGNPGTACDAGQVCSGGACTVSCQPGLIKCDGTCIDPATSRAHCGATGNCTSIGAGNSEGAPCAAGNLCVAGSCAISCPTGSVNCGGVCINPATDNGHCGAFGNCTNVGAGNNAGTACTQGMVCNDRVCGVVCQAGYVNCGGVCVDPSTNRTYCGATGNCVNLGAGNSAGMTCAAGNLCVAGSCTVSCPTGSVNCGGVCINPQGDNTYCGATGTCANTGGGNSAGSSCDQGRVCNNGTCAVICQTGLVNCGGVCIDPAGSRTHCGATGDCTNVGAGNSAGATCAAGNLCVAGSCTVSCPTGSVNCGGVCVNPQTDNSHCGASGNCTSTGTGNSAGSVCSAGSMCTAGSCDLSCGSGLHACSNMCVDWSYNPNHCGSCGAACSANHIAQPACSASTCNGACDAGYSDCDADKRTNGCEINSASDTANCGGCSVAGDHNCNRNATGGVCTNGFCTGATCATGYANCDSLANNGCETTKSGAGVAGIPGYSSITNYFTLDGTVGNIANGATITASIGTNGTATNGNSGMTYVTGQISQAMNLDGNDDSVDLGVNFGNFGTADFSVGMWLKGTTLARTQWVLTKRAYCNHSPFWNFGIASNGRLIFEIDEDFSGTNYGAVNGATSITDGIWHYVVFVRQGTALRIYLDGNLDSSGTSSGVTNLVYSYNARIGQISCAGGQNFRGQIDDLAIWMGYALTQAEIRLIACTGGR